MWQVGPTVTFPILPCGNSYRPSPRAPNTLEAASADSSISRRSTSKRSEGRRRAVLIGQGDASGTQRSAVQAARGRPLTSPTCYNNQGLVPISTSSMRTAALRAEICLTGTTPPAHASCSSTSTRRRLEASESRQRLATGPRMATPRRSQRTTVTPHVGVPSGRAAGVWANRPLPSGLLT